jgi:8-oxo-dGTP diphosphatase
MSSQPGILARGPWQTGQVAARWREEPFAADRDQEAAADAALADFRSDGDALELELQPMRWSLRLLPAGADGALSVLCVVRDADGRWLAGRRAGWVATWAGRWALGAGGTVEVNEDPVEALSRELEEEWAVQPERLAIEALVRLPSGMVMLIGQAWIGTDPAVTRDPEHDEHAWWPADPGEWPEEAGRELRLMAGLIDP